jgi:hypothetical protein
MNLKKPNRTEREKSMKESDRKCFRELINAADAAMNAQPRSDAAVDLMFEVLRDCEICDVRAAVNAHVRASPYAVKPSDIVSHIDDTPDESSTLAWLTFLGAVDRYGYYDSVRFPVPAYHYVIQHMGGWERLSEKYRALTDKELLLLSKDWHRLYEIGLQCATWSGEVGKEPVPAYLWVFYERDNREKGCLDFLPEVIDIGLALKTSFPAFVGANGEINLPGKREAS